MTPQAWGVVFGAASVVVVMAAMMGWFVSRAFAKLDALEVAVTGLRVELAGRYVTKDDCREERANCPARDALMEIASPAKRRPT